ncbi:serine hydrolase [Clostridium sp. CF012]|uniref:serine hydrolase domain-containing protein n=1 Tax=Clostridium sp. CF012 TaxID=2843319 RepID=UPI001C0D50D0|nr:serine hydrolase domain-containing protein [Clostridium sp. CF012]MBU3146123.1 beta-lactamase family protein [Clostridium sp. CF012]
MNRLIGRFILGIVGLVMSVNLLGNSNIAIASNKTPDNRSLDVFKNKLDKLVPELQKRYGVPGTAIGIIQDGEIKYVLNYGLEDKKKDKAISDDTVFQAASMSKSLTAWGVMKLVEEGEISLDHPAEKYLTRWHLSDSKYDKDKVTIKQLLSHTAGLTVHGYLGIEPGKEMPTIEESLSGNGLFNVPLEITMLPGNDVSYSGGGYTLLQLIIEEVTGKTFDQYMEKEILKPLEMENSSFSNNFLAGNMSKGYGYFEQEIPNYDFTEKAAAGLKTTVPDFLKFMLASIDGINVEGKGKNILKSKTIDLIHKSVLLDSAIGVFSKKLSDGSELLYHSGDNRGWHAVYGLIPQKKDGIVIFTNSDNGIDLRQDIYNFWIEYETGTLPDQYYAMEKSRNTNFVVAAMLGVMLVIYILSFVVSLKHGKRVFILKKEDKLLFKLFVRLFIPLSLGSVIYYVLYEMNILQLQGGTKNIASIILVWIIAIFITGFFSKNIKENKSY